MTKEELKSHLQKLAGDRTDDETITTVETIMTAFRPDEVDELNRQLEAERERFRKRFWGGEEERPEGSSGNHRPARDYGETKRNASELYEDFFKGI